MSTVACTGPSLSFAVSFAAPMIGHFHAQYIQIHDAYQEGKGETAVWKLHKTLVSVASISVLCWLSRYSAMRQLTCSSECWPEGEALGNEVVEHHAQAPHVGLHPILPPEHLRCHVHWSPCPAVRTCNPVYRSLLHYSIRLYLFLYYITYDIRLW